LCFTNIICRILDIMKKIFLILFAVVFITSCQRVASTISSYSNLTHSASNLNNKTFFIIADDNQKTSVEFQNYASSISSRLSNKGFYRASSERNADYIILFNYGISGKSVKTGSIPITGPIGGGTSYHSGSVYGSGGGYGSYSGTSYSMPTWGVVGSQSYSYSVHQRYFQLKMIDKDNNPVYETKASSEGTSANFGIVAECIFDMALKDFPYSVQKNENVALDGCGK